MWHSFLPMSRSEYSGRVPVASREGAPVRTGLKRNELLMTIDTSDPAPSRHETHALRPAAQRASAPSLVDKDLYRGHWLTSISTDRCVWVCDTRDDVDCLWDHGLPAVAPPGGLVAWDARSRPAFARRDVVIITAGRSTLDSSARIAVDLSGVARSVRVLLLDRVTAHTSLAAWFAAGGTAPSLERIARRLRPVDLSFSAPRQPDPPTPRPSAVTTRLSHVAPRPVAWLWDRWLPLGKLSILGGHPGVGKSMLSAGIAATLSVGGRWPDGSPAQLASTIFLLAEDAADDTLRPRLDLLGADPDRILSLDAVDDGAGSEVYFNLGKHLEALEHAIVAEGAKLVVIDPLSAFLPRRNRNDEGDVRDLLTPLARMAERRSVAILAIMHVGKQSSGRTALQSLLGTTAFGAIARSVIMAASLPGTADSPRNALAVVKSNLAQTPPPLEWSRPHDSPILWHGESRHDIEALLGSIPGNARHTSLDIAEAFLRDILAHGPMPTADVEAAAAASGITRRTLKRARRSLAVESRRLGGKDLTWYLMLPGTRTD